MITKLSYEKRMSDIGSLMDKVLAGRDAEIAMLRAKLSEAGDGWIEWHGGDCPVDGETMVEVKYSSLPIDPHVASAGGWRWDHKGMPADVTAYRIDHEATIKALTASRDKWRDLTARQHETIVELNNKLAAANSLETAVLEALGDESLTLIETVTRVRQSELHNVRNTLAALVASGKVRQEFDGTTRYSVRKPQRTMVWFNCVSSGKDLI